MNSFGTRERIQLLRGVTTKLLHQEGQRGGGSRGKTKGAQTRTLSPCVPVSNLDTKPEFFLRKEQLQQQLRQDGQGSKFLILPEGPTPKTFLPLALHLVLQATHTALPNARAYRKTPPAAHSICSKAAKSQQAIPVQFPPSSVPRSSNTCAAPLLTHQNPATV